MHYSYDLCNKHSRITHLSHLLLIRPAKLPFDTSYSYEMNIKFISDMSEITLYLTHTLLKHDFGCVSHTTSPPNISPLLLIRPTQLLSHVSYSYDRDY